MGLYRGEALKVLGDIELEKRYDYEKAKNWYSKALEWTKDASESDREFEGYKVPEKALGVTSPPDSTYSYDQFKNLVRVKPEPGHLVNRKTAKWYISEINKQCHLKLGFIYFVKGEFKNAESMFLNVLEDDATISHLQSKNRPNVYRRLLRNCNKKQLEADKKTMQ